MPEEELCLLVWGFSIVLMGHVLSAVLGTCDMGLFTLQHKLNHLNLSVLESCKDNPMRPHTVS